MSSNRLFLYNILVRKLLSLRLDVCYISHSSSVSGAGVCDYLGTSPDMKDGSHQSHLPLEETAACPRQTLLKMISVSSTVASNTAQWRAQRSTKLA